MSIEKQRLENINDNISWSNLWLFIIMITLMVSCSRIGDIDDHIVINQKKEQIK